MQRYIGLSILSLLVLISALGIVYSKHESRQLFVELQALQVKQDAMNVDWGRLQLEQSTWATHGRIASAARNKLDMVVPANESVRIINK